MKATEYKSQIRCKDWSLLYSFWQKRRTSGWDKGKALEYSILRAFELEGADVAYPYEVSDSLGVFEQIDGVIYVDNLCIIAESKDYSNYNLDIEPIAKLQVRLLRRPATVIGCVFSSTGFTWPAQTLIETLEPRTILLWDKEDIEYCFKNRCFIKALRKKFRQVVETGNHYYKVSIRL